MMALFNKLLFNKKRNTSSSSQKTSPGQFPFSADQVRILVFKECDIRGRKLLFDSSTVEKVSSDSNSAAAAAAFASDHHPSSVPQVQKCEHCNVVYRVRKQNDPRNEAKTEIKQFEEMVFGSAPIAFRGSSFKVHWLKAPKTLMCSLVFPTPVYSGTKKSSVSTYPGSELFINSGGSGTGSTGAVGGNGVDYNPSVSDLSSIGTGSLHSFTVTSSTATQHDPSMLHRLRPVLPAEFCNFDRFADLRHSSNSGVDSGYGGTDPWGLSGSGSSRHPASSSHRSSLSSIYSDFDYIRRMSTDNFSMDIPPPPNCVSLEDCHSYGSFHRRVSKNLSTSFENRHTIADHVGHLDELGQMLAGNGVGPPHTPTNATASDGCVVSRNRRNSEIMDLNRRKAYSGELLSTATNYQGKAPSKKQRLGLAVCIRLNDVMLQDTDTFCSEHMTVFESILCRVRLAVEKAYIRWRLFLQIMLGAWHSTQQWLNDLFTAPRINNPVWLTLSSSTLTDRNLSSLASTFMNDLCSLLSLADTKDTNFFISTLITAVLTHHLGWVGTIAAMTATDDANSKLDLIRREKTRMNEITANHPYSVLWAQLGDLYGAVGFPMKLSKTIICGSSQLSNMLDKILNVLSYFIRCSEIKRTVYVESFDEANVRTAFVSQRANINNAVHVEDVPPADTKVNVAEQPIGLLEATGQQLLRSASSGMVRSATRMKNLASLGGDGDQDNSKHATAGESTSNAGNEEVQKALKKNVMNDIPNVLVYRDSRFVRQELRIGNKSMDTGLVMNAREKQYLEARYQIGKVALLHTQPQSAEAELAQEALVLDGNEHRTMDDADDRESVRLSYLITENSLGQVGTTEAPDSQQRLIWGVEKTKEGIAFEQLKYISLLRGDYKVQKDTVNDSGSELKSGNNNNEVVFVLGENEMLKDIHRKTTGSGQDVADVLTPLGMVQPLKHCCQQKFSSFDKYRQIAAKFLKNRNLPDNHLLERGKLLSTEEAGLVSPLSELSFEFIDQQGKNGPTECAICHQIPTIFCLQTPTNASEMEFVGDFSDGNHRPCWKERTLSEQLAGEEVAGAASDHPSKPAMRENIPLIVLPGHTMATLDENDELRVKHPGSILKLIDIPFPKGMRTSASGPGNDENNNSNGAGSGCSSGGSGHGGGNGSNAGGGSGSNSGTHHHHMLDSGSTGNDKTDKGLRCFRTGFMPSLFSRITDHYMPDMVLQATTAPPSQWEASLKRDLHLAARFTLYEQQHTENNAIIANLDTHEVRLLSSQSLVDGDIIGMSQLVSSMLEAVNAMWSAGISAYQCMAFMESKLRELYLQSETLASVMLATDFCTMSSITTAMDITANDMELLLSVASVHTPEATKRYRVLMR
ncbi:folliculin-interacting protein 2 isoform X1 [Anopheles funestus]|uniref:folliculin-interacting protein 2 isoform X1 n=1 Tax=Anopheles funestus TaxID=62324 RepID=UPI0020C656F9|nr:folliculin-interacting protein 2 isoform X1 [Anopheles funestus]XP_049297418.1 folliculin-interacting protein 2 isoform X1 [Anopheles funestus]